MAGAAFHVDLDDQLAQSLLAGIQSRSADMQPAWDEVGSTVVAHTLLRFDQQVDPDGNRWTPLSPVTIALRGGGNPHILVEHGILRGSITHNARQDGVDIGTNVIYGAIQQLGGQAGRGGSVTIPPRPYLGLDAADREDIPEILGRFLMGGGT